MTPQQFSAKWTASTLKERSGAQEHFLDLCHMLGELTPAEADPRGEWFCFERGAKKTGGGDGWADVWRRGCFAWEYKGKHKDLDAAFAQLQRYAIALENPPLLVVSDMSRIEIHTNFNNTVHQKHVIPIEEIGVGGNLQLLKSAFSDPKKLQPGTTKSAITEEAARRFASLAEILRDRGGEPQRVAHFLNRILFCLYAQDAGLLPGSVVKEVLETGVRRPDQADQMLATLFRTMKRGGPFGTHVIEWFNGSLFESSDSIPLESCDIRELLAVSDLDWSAIEPSIFGTLFERGLDPDKRGQIGAHYTDPQSIMRVVQPTIVSPLAAQWEVAKGEIAILMAKAQRLRVGPAYNKIREHASKVLNTFLQSLADFRVLDPACGSGNFLYLALQSLKDIEHRALLEAEQLGLEAQFSSMHVGVQCVHGIELNTYAAELARVTAWIGEIQWMLRHGMQPSRNPILKRLDTIECRDALIDSDGAEARWPAADAIVGNPPFLGDKKMIGKLGQAYVTTLRKVFKGRVPGAADLVTYWFEKARGQIEFRKTKLAGLVATNSIRGGANRKALERICESSKIFDAWSDEEWINEGASVRVSLVCFGNREVGKLDGQAVRGINADLSPAGVDLTKAQQLTQNGGCCFYATVKAGPFDIDGATARKWLQLPNPSGRPNQDVVKPWANGIDITRRPTDKWVVDFGVDMPLRAAALYEAPFAYVLKHVKPEREETRREKYRKFWWLFAEPIPGMRRALKPLRRFIATPALSKHRVFVWMSTAVIPDHAMMAIARDDDESFGVLHSRFHELWALRMGTSLEDRPRYTPTTTFETFPFPDGLTPNLPALDYTNTHKEAIANAAKELNRLRHNWLNPTEWTKKSPEVVPGYPPRIEAIPGHDADLKKRTLTNLYNERPMWLRNAHADLDLAVAMAYGWTDYTASMPDREIIARLLALNGNRAPDLLTSATRHSPSAVGSDQVSKSQEIVLNSQADKSVLDRRLAVVCTLINRLADDRNFGRTKMAKLFYLADASQNLALQTTYYREAAGPLDTKAFYSRKDGIESLARRNNYITVTRVGAKIKYTRGSNLDVGMHKAREILGHHRAALNKLIDLFRPLDTSQCELVATLYACWNDLLLDAHDASDDSIVKEFLGAWHEKKRRFSKQRLVKALVWMRSHHLVPAGRGSHTMKKRQTDN